MYIRSRKTQQQKKKETNKLKPISVHLHVQRFMTFKGAENTKLHQNSHMYT